MCSVRGVIKGGTPGKFTGCKDDSARLFLPSPGTFRIKKFTAKKFCPLLKTLAVITAPAEITGSKTGQVNKNQIIGFLYRLLINFKLEHCLILVGIGK